MSLMLIFTLPVWRAIHAVMVAGISPTTAMIAACMLMFFEKPSRIEKKDSKRPNLPPPPPAPRRARYDG